MGEPEYSRKSNRERRAKKEIKAIMNYQGTLFERLGKQGIAVKFMGFGPYSFKASKRGHRGLRNVDYEMRLPRDWMQMMHTLELPLRGDLFVLHAERVYRRDGIQTLRVHYTTYANLCGEIINDGVISGYAARLLDRAAWTFHCGHNVELAINLMYEKYITSMGLPHATT